MKIPTPEQLGLSISSWRAGQEEMVHRIALSIKRAKAICMPTGGGKCFAAGTPVLMYGGRIKNIEDIEIGEAVMTPQSTPAIVYGLHQGMDEMYEITPTKGDPHTISAEHILCLAITPDGKSPRTSKHQFIEISIEDYLKRSFTFKHTAKLYRQGMDLPGPFPDLPITPYLLGVWLGDGSSLEPDITTADDVIITYLEGVAAANNFRLVKKAYASDTCPTYAFRDPEGGSGRNNRFLDALRDLGVSPVKKVPHAYKVASIGTRLEILAGLLDSDGYLAKRTVFEFSNKNRTLAYDVLFLARSVGLAAYVNLEPKSCQTGVEGYYYRVKISGHTEFIPTKLERKQATPRLQKKNVLYTGFSVKPIGIGEYFGISLFPEEKFLLGDFTVVHNSHPLVAAALISSVPTCIVTASKGLQTQYLKEFAPIGMVDIRGRNNYTCQMREDYTCEDGNNSRCPYKGTVACPSSQAEMRAATSNLVVTNYSKWCASKKYGQGMAHFKQVIFDEGHAAPEALAASMQVILHHREIEKDLALDFLAGSDAEKFSVWKPWALRAKLVADQKLIIAKARIAGLSNPKTSWVRHINHLQNLTRRLATLAAANAQEWIVEEIPEGYKFDPLRPGRYAEAGLLFRIPSVIIASATLRPKTMFMMGIGKDHFDFKEFDSDFDPKRCPIYYVPTMRVDGKALDMSPLWLKLDQIAGRRRDRKGIIHTVSYARRDDIMATSRFASSMIVNEKGSPTTETVELFKKSAPGTMLVSPSVDTGYDFPGSECEFQFLCKIPFEPPSRILKAREQLDKEYRAYQAMQTMVQAFGRGMRSKKDSCENFIGDSHLEWFLPRYGHLAPSSFHDFFKEMQVLPAPPKPLGGDWGV